MLSLYKIAVKLIVVTEDNNILLLLLFVIRQCPEYLVTTFTTVAANSKYITRKAQSS